MPFFNIVAATNENTVVTEYEPVKSRSDSYQSEAELEKEFIRLLCEQGYTYLPIHTEKDLIANLRERLEELNNYMFSDSEWDRFFNEAIANPNDKIEDKTRKIQEDFVQVLKRDDALTKNILLIDRKNIHNNRLQVINQYVIGTDQGAKHDNRYDVTILVNGFPLVHVELKRRDVAIREAFNQINRYQRDSFWAGCGLFEYAQIFVISNGTNTKYYSNSTRFNAIKDATSGKTKKEKTSNSFEFTSFWADANNRVIPDLIDFTKTFFAKHTILNILTKYCVFTSENMLMVMRPYQITAKKYHDTHGEDKELLITIRKAVDASLELRSKKALIETFIAGINDVDDVMLEWQDYIVAQREKDLIIIIEQEKLKPDETRKFLENCFREGEVKTTGTDIDKLLPPVSRFGGGGARAKKKKTVIEKLMGYFEKYSGLGVVAFKAKQEEDKVITYDFAKTPVYMVAEEPAEYGKKED